MMDLKERTGTGAAADLADLRANATRASTLLKAMANKQRLMILCHLGRGREDRR